ncbi:MAG: nucleotide pyrophosphohydrolase [Bacteroidetes bacterium]|nr:nucleotide pyrophosphohydrolase [Bacteroidota bacterium]
MTDKNTQLQPLINIIKELRGISGCPWDKKQKPKTIIKYIEEEACELIEAIESQDTSNTCEETGDLLYLLIFLTEMHSEKNLYTFQDVINSIKSKLIRRHPHVFGKSQAKTDKELTEQWKNIKKQEKDHKKKI